jgi:hypothetical protein
MRRRDLRVSLVLVLAVGLSLAAGVPAGTVAADHGGSAGSDEIVEVWTFVTEGTDPGTSEFFDRHVRSRPDRPTSCTSTTDRGRPP